MKYSRVLIVITGLAFMATQAMGNNSRAGPLRFGGTALGAAVPFSLPVLEDSRLATSQSAERIFLSGSIDLSETDGSPAGLIDTALLAAPNSAVSQIFLTVTAGGGDDGDKDDKDDHHHKPPPPRSKHCPSKDDDHDKDKDKDKDKDHHCGKGDDSGKP